MNKQTHSEEAVDGQQAAADEPTNESPDASSEPAVKVPPTDEQSDDILADMTAERDQLKDQLLRALADTENMRRRSEREASNVRKYGHTPFARDLVGALDNLGRAVDSVPDDLDSLDEPVKSLVTGIQLSWTELQSVIQKHGIAAVSPKGEKFDYNFHQAMFEVPTDDVPPGMVVEVAQHGYVLHDRLLRPAMVGVSKPVSAQQASVQDTSKSADGGDAE